MITIEEIKQVADLVENVSGGDGYNVTARKDAAVSLRSCAKRIEELEANQAPERLPPIDHMVNRFLQWQLPKTFNPDGGISFNPIPLKGCWPVGTNLFDYVQAKEMLEFALGEYHRPREIIDAKYDNVLVPFARLMAKELHVNAGKGDRPGWLSMTPAVGMLEIYYHAAKLQKAVKDDNGEGIREYAADVANMAMMLLDLCGGLAVADTALRQAPAQSGVTEAMNWTEFWNRISQNFDSADVDKVHACYKAALSADGKEVVR